MSIVAEGSERQARLGPHQALVIGLCAIVAMFDGFDTQAIGFVAPVIARSWSLPVGRMGPVIAVGLFAGLLGSFAFGVVADRRGRRATIIVTTALIAAGSLLTLLSRNMVDLAAYRVITGIGLGGAIPSIIALSAEYSPPRLRASTVTAMFCGVPLGAVIGATVAVPLMSDGGWRSVFFVGGVGPLLLLAPLLAWLPESIGWLVAKDKTEAADRTRLRMGMVTDAAPPSAPAAAPAPATLALLALFGGKRALATSCLWAAFFLSLLLVFFLVSWIPSIVVAQSQTPSMGAAAAALFNLSGVAGAIVISRLIDRFGAFAVVASAYALAAAGILAIGLGHDARASVFVFSIVAGFFGEGAQLCIVAIAADFYPITLRATGVGAALGVGRFGAIAGSLVGGALMAGGVDHFPPTLAGLAAAACLAVLGAGLFKRRALV